MNVVILFETKVLLIPLSTTPPPVRATVSSAMIVDVGSSAAPIHWFPSRAGMTFWGYARETPERR